MMAGLSLLKEIKGDIKEVFEDILEERRVSSDLRYAMKSFTPVMYKTPHKPTNIKSIVLDSPNLRQVVLKISVESREPSNVVEKRAAQIFDEMSDNLKLGAIRLFALSLSKIFKRLYRKVFVNLEGIQKLAKAIQEHPVVLLPNHRSYIDFLLISYIMYTYELAIPVIAAGEDLSRMTFVGPFLRLSGAFFIRRTFREDKLYWTVFSEYVKAVLRTGYAPLEFFIEGQRSRTGKTLQPRLGLLNVIAEPFFSGEVYDTYLVPISISYEKTLEEASLAQELLGAQKNKESTSGLIKARKLLKSNFGNIHVHFAEPISLRSAAAGRIDRSRYNLAHRHGLQRPPEEIQKFISDLAYKVELHQVANMVLSPGDLIAVILLQNLPVLNYSLLVEKIYLLKKLIEDFGGSVDWPDDQSIHEVVGYNVSLHADIMALVDGHLALLEHNFTKVLTEELLTKQALTFLTATSYRNKMVNVFIRPALVVVACKMAQSFQKDDVQRAFCFLRNLLSREFIFCRGKEEEDFEEGCHLLARCDVISRTSSEIFINDNNVAAQFLFGMLNPVSEGYWLACTYLTQNLAESFTDKQYVAAVRRYVFGQILTGASRCYDALSSDLLKNSLASFIQLGIVRARETNSGTLLSADAEAVIHAAATLDIPSRKFPASRL